MVDSKIIGKGNFGVVFKGQEVYSGRQVAIKKFINNPELNVNEIVVWKTLDHPNILKLWHAFTTIDTT